METPPLHPLIRATEGSQGEHRGQSPLAFFLIYALTWSALLLASRGGLYTLLVPVGLTFVVIPIFDASIGVDTRNPPESEPGRLTRAAFRLATWLAVPTQAMVLLWAASVWATPGAGWLDLAGAVTAAGVCGGVIGITVAHELVHRASRVDRALGAALLAIVCYRHFEVEHVAGHHRRVATREDPATARFGESLPAFWLRSVVQGFRSAWALEAARHRKLGLRSPLQNRVVSGLLWSASCGAALSLAFGGRAVVFFLGQSLIAILFLETINYVEHYGLERRLVSPGVYERVTPLHSWNASHWLTNALLFNLQRHSDHHVFPARPYYRLRHHPDSPQLPGGYATMALLAMIPPLWRRVMDPRVEAHRARLAALRAPQPPNA